MKIDKFIVNLEGEFLNKTLGLEFYSFFDDLEFSNGKFSKDGFKCRISGDFFLGVKNEKLKDEKFMDRLQNFIETVMKEKNTMKDYKKEKELAEFKHKLNIEELQFQRETSKMIYEFNKDLQRIKSEDIKKTKEINRKRFETGDYQP